MVKFTVQTCGQLDIMFSNAGNQTLLDLDLSQLDRLFTINACVKHAAHAMVEQRVRGSIVCKGSVAGSKGGSKRTDYAMSKHAVLGLVRSASLQLGVHGIRVNSVSPSAVPTSLTGSLVEEVKTTIYEPLTSLKRVEPTVRQIADAVMFLVCDDSTGQDLIVDGGLVKLPGPENVPT